MRVRAEGVDLLPDDELVAVSGRDQVAHLPRSIHIDYGKLSIDQNPTRRLIPKKMPARAQLRAFPQTKRPFVRCTAEICELFLVGAELGQDPVLIGDLDDVGGVDAFPLDSRRFHL